MPIRVYDYRRDIQNLEVTPEIRSRFMRLGPHESADRHSHDLGHEVFLVLEGKAEFEINGETAVLGPGQFCFSKANDHHCVRNLWDEPMTMYLSVTPHIEPTHTHWNEQGEKLPPRYGGWRAWSAGPGDTSAGSAVAELAEQQSAALRQLQESVQQAIAVQEQTLASVGDGAAGPARAVEVKAAVDQLWAGLYPVFRDVGRLASVWNELAVRATGRQQ